MLIVVDRLHRRTSRTAAPQTLHRFSAHYLRQGAASDSAVVVAALQFLAVTVKAAFTTDHAHHLSVEALGRAATPRQRSLVGLHDPYFYDA